MNCDERRRTNETKTEAWMVLDLVGRREALRVEEELEGRKVKRREEKRKRKSVGLLSGSSLSSDLISDRRLRDS